MKRAGLLTLIIFLLAIFISTEIAIAKTKFRDVSSKHWAEDDIVFLSEKNIISGYPNGNFGPTDQIKRVDAAIMIARALNLDTKNRPNPGFKDVSTTSYGYNVIAAVTDEGLFTGTNGSFLPNKSLTRAEMATIITRAYKLEKKSGKLKFKDISTKFWGYNDIQVLVTNEITTGFNDNTFRPNQPTTRAEFASFMSRVINNAVETPDQITDEEPIETTEPEDEKFKVINIY